MGEKKRKLEQNPPDDVAVIEPEGKKAKREGKKEKKEKKRKQQDVAETVNGVEEAIEKKSKKDKKEKKDKEEKKKKKEKKEKNMKTADEDVEEESTKETNGAEPEHEANQEPEAMDIDGDVIVTEKSGKEKKKDKKAKKEKKQKDKEQSNPESDQQEEAEAPAKQKAARFIVFVGNLPYSANAESLKAHFEKIQPISVRVATQPDKPTKCRGFGFVEFDNYDRMKTCLKLYHHSSFDDGKYPPRRINVELTAGGGGKSDHRKAKIEYKNQKLAEERKRQATDTKKEKQQKPEGNDAGADPFAGIHPSRRMRMA